MGAQKVGLGLRGGKGGAIAVAVVLEDGQPRVIASSLLKTHEEGDRLSLEPFAMAYERRESGEAATIVAEGQRRQEVLAAQALRALFGTLSAAGDEHVAVALLVNRAGWITDLLDYSLAFADHVPVAEGLAVREAFRRAFRANGIRAVELDEKSLAEAAAGRFGLTPSALDARLKALGATAGKPWRKEQKLACLAAWTAAVAEG